MMMMMIDVFNNDTGRGSKSQIQLKCTLIKNKTED